MNARVVGVVAVVVAGVAGLLLLRDEPAPATPEVAEPSDAPVGAPAPTAPETPLEEPAPAEPDPVVETEGFAQPWGLAFLPDGQQLLVTQAPGRLSVVDTTTGSRARHPGCARGGRSRPGRAARRCCGSGL